MSIPQPALALMGGDLWLHCFSEVREALPEVGRALTVLEVLQTQLSSVQTTESSAKVVRKALHKYLGQSKCPSAQTCEKLGIRVRILLGWSRGLAESGALQPASPVHQARLTCLAMAMERLIPMCEGADDRHNVLIPAVRDLCRHWLIDLGKALTDASIRAHWIYPLAMLDQAGVVQPEWWWKALVDSDVDSVLAMVEAEVSALQELTPSVTVSWKSYGQRWRRLRLKALLQYLKETRLLSELLRRSAVDDFEAAEALHALAKAGRYREAVAQGEDWMRRLPRSAVLAEALLEVYVHDGWDEEATALLKSLYAQDPNPRWQALSSKYFPTLSLGS